MHGRDLSKHAPASALAAPHRFPYRPAPAARAPPGRVAFPAHTRYAVPHAAPRPLLRFPGLLCGGASPGEHRSPVPASAGAGGSSGPHRLATSPRIATTQHRPARPGPRHLEARYESRWWNAAIAVQHAPARPGPTMRRPGTSRGPQTPVSRPDPSLAGRTAAGRARSETRVKHNPTNPVCRWKVHGSRTSTTK